MRVDRAAGWVHSAAREEIRKNSDMGLSDTVAGRLDEAFEDDAPVSIIGDAIVSGAR